MCQADNFLGQCPVHRGSYEWILQAEVTYSASWPCSMSDNQKFSFLVPALTIRRNCLLSSSFNGKSHSCCQSMNVTIIYLFSHFTVVLGISGRSLCTHLINSNPASNDLQSKLLIQEGTCTYMLFKSSEKHVLTCCHTPDENFLQCYPSRIRSWAENIMSCEKIKSCGEVRISGCASSVTTFSAGFYKEVRFMQSCCLPVCLPLIALKLGQCQPHLAEG